MTQLPWSFEVCRACAVLDPPQPFSPFCAALSFRQGWGWGGCSFLASAEGRGWGWGEGKEGKARGLKFLAHVSDREGRGALLVGGQVVAAGAGHSSFLEGDGKPCDQEQARLSSELGVF